MLTQNRSRLSSCSSSSLASCAFDFTEVVGALDEYTRRTGQAPLSLGGWEVEDAAISPPAVLSERLSAISARLHGYTYMRELLAAKRSAADTFAYGIRLEGQPLAPEQIAIAANSTQALLLTLAALNEQGMEQVVIAAPGYFAAVEACRHLGLALTIVPAADYLSGALDIAAIVEATRRCRSAVIVTNPAYSIGVEYGWSCLRALFAALPPDAFVILDETRLGLNWQDEAPWYKADYPAQVIVIRSPSKIFFINGLKTSIIVGSAHLIRVIELLSEALLGSVPGATEQVALAYLDCWRQWVDELRTGEVGPLRLWRREVVACFRRNQRIAASYLKQRGFMLSQANSGPYLLAAIEREGNRVVNGCDVARDTGVLMMDSSYFFHEDNQWWGFRVNLCNRRQHLAAAIERVFPHGPAEPAAANIEQLSQTSLVS